MQPNFVRFVQNRFFIFLHFLVMEKDEWVTGQIQLAVDDMLFEMQLTVQANPVKPQRMLPVFQQITNLYVEMGVAATKSQGKSISCKKGCGACCRHFVALSEIEAYDIAEIVEKMPEPRRSQVKERFNKALAHFTEIGWIERFESCGDYSDKESMQVLVDYFKEGIPCPFLVDESCSIHDERPLTCREYLVTSPAENCADPTKYDIDLVKLPTRPLGHILELGQEKPLNGLNVVPLITALKQVEMKPNNFPEKTGEEWMTEFLQSITKGEIPQESAKD